MLYRYSTCADSPHADTSKSSKSSVSPVTFDVDKLKLQLLRHPSRIVNYHWWYPVLRVFPSSVHTLWLSIWRYTKTKRTRPSVFIVKVPFRPPEAYVCPAAKQQYTSRHTPSKLSSHSKSLTHTLSPPSSHRSTSSSSSYSHHPSSVSSSQSHSHSHSTSSRGPALSQPHSRIYQDGRDERLLHGVEIDTDADADADPLDYHTCNDPTCQANLDAYFLHRIETYTPMLQMMRSRRKTSGRSGVGGISDHDSAPVVVVTNWQHAEQYPPEWVAKFEQVVKRSLDPSPIFIETFGTDEQTEDQLMEVIEQVKTSPEFLLTSSKSGDGGSVCKSFSAAIDDDDISLLDSPGRSKSSNFPLRWRTAVTRQYWPLILVALLLVCVVVFRHLLVASPPPRPPLVVAGSGVDDHPMMSVDGVELGPLDNESRFDPEYVSDGGSSEDGYLNAGDYQPRPPDALA